MTNDIIILTGTAAIIGFVHTLAGPDHYLPFIVLSKSRQWSHFKTLLITFFCGIGHVLSSVVLGFLGVAMGIAVLKLKIVESFRGELASWLLIMFGFVYAVWGLHRAIRNRPHRHLHFHQAGDEHLHEHGHTGEHTHPHISQKNTLAPWALFIIFVFGPCEPLIPLVMYPAARHNMPAVVLVTFIFSLVTIATMLAVVLVSSYSLSKLHFHRLERYSHAMAGSAIFLCGAAIKLFGL